MLRMLLVLSLVACSSERRPAAQAGDGPVHAEQGQEEPSSEGAGSGEGEGEPGPTPDPDGGADPAPAPDGGEGEGEAAPPDPAPPVRLADQVSIEALVWGETPTLWYVPTASWALALAHAERILQQAGLPLTANAVAAFALKESFMGCDPDTPPNPFDPGVRWAYQPAAELDGCFQIECGSAFSELKRLFPDRFGPVTHAQVVGGDRFETAALTMAHYMVFASAMMRMHVPDSAEWMRRHPDKEAGAKALAIVYNRGAWSEALRVAMNDCGDAGELVGCVEGPVGCQPGATDVCDYMRAIGAYTAELSVAAGREGLLYDEPLTADALDAYVDAIAPLYPAGAVDNARAAALQAHARYAQGQASPGFQQVAAPVLDALTVALPATEDPGARINCCFGVQCPPETDCGAAFECPPPLSCDAPPACDEVQ